MVMKSSMTITILELLAAVFTVFLLQYMTTWKVPRSGGCLQEILTTVNGLSARRYFKTCLHLWEVVSGRLIHETMISIKHSQANTCVCCDSYFILGLILTSHCFKIILIHYYTPKQRKPKCKPRKNLTISHTVHWSLDSLHPPTDNWYYFTLLSCSWAS